MQTDNDDLFDALHRVMSTTGLDTRAIALKARVAREPLEAFVEDSTTELDDDTAVRLAVFASHAIDNPLGMVLTMVREACDESHADVSEATGLNRYSISKWERGDRVPQTDALLELWKHYNAQLGGGLDFGAFAGGDLGAVKAWLDGVGS